MGVYFFIAALWASLAFAESGATYGFEAELDPNAEVSQNFIRGMSQTTANRRDYPYLAPEASVEAITNNIEVRSEPHFDRPTIINQMNDVKESAGGARRAGGAVISFHLHIRVPKSQTKASREDLEGWASRLSTEVHAWRLENIQTAMAMSQRTVQRNPPGYMAEKGTTRIRSEGDFWDVEIRGFASNVPAIDHTAERIINAMTTDGAIKSYGDLDRAMFLRKRSLKQFVEHYTGSPLTEREGQAVAAMGARSDTAEFPLFGFEDNPLLKPSERKLFEEKNAELAKAIRARAQVYVADNAMQGEYFGALRKWATDVNLYPTMQRLTTTKVDFQKAEEEGTRLLWQRVQSSIRSGDASSIDLVLDTLAKRQSPDMPGDVKDWLVRHYDVEPSDFGKREVVLALGEQNGAAVEAVMRKAMKDLALESTTRRHAISWLLHGPGADKRLPALFSEASKILDSPAGSGMDYYEALLELLKKQLTPAEYFEKLAQLSKKQGRHAHLDGAVMSELARHPDPRAMEILKSMLGQASTLNKEIVFRALGHVGSEKAFEILREQLGKENYQKNLEILLQALRRDPSEKTARALEAKITATAKFPGFVQKAAAISARLARPEPAGNFFRKHLQAYPNDAEAFIEALQINPTALGEPGLRKVVEEVRGGRLGSGSPMETANAFKAGQLLELTEPCLAGYAASALVH